MLLSPGAERRSNTDRRGGVDRRAGAERRGGADSRDLSSHGFGLGTETDGAARHPEPVHLRRVLPHARFNESEAAERTAAIAAHQHELSARLERNVGLSVAALDYLLNISGDLVAPTIVEHEILEVLEHRSLPALPVAALAVADGRRPAQGGERPVGAPGGGSDARSRRRSDQGQSAWLRHRIPLRR